MVPGAEAGLPTRFAGRSRDFHRRAAVEATGRAHLALTGSPGLPPHRRRDGGQQHDGVADVRALLVRDTRDRWRCGSDLRQADQLLSVHSAHMAVHHGLAADAGRDFLCNRRFLHFRYGEHTNALGTARQIHLAAVARVLHCVWVLVADPRDARVYRPIRTIVRRTYDFWRGRLYGCSRHASRDARRVCRVSSRRCDCKHQCRVGAARALVGGGGRSRRRLLSRTSNIGLVRQQLYREAQRTGSRATLHCLQY